MFFPIPFCYTFFFKTMSKFLNVQITLELLKQNVLCKFESSESLKSYSELNELIN